MTETRETYTTPTTTAEIHTPAVPWIITPTLDQHYVDGVMEAASRWYHAREALEQAGKSGQQIMTDLFDAEDKLASAVRLYEDVTADREPECNLLP